MELMQDRVALVAGAAQDISVDVGDVLYVQAYHGAESRRYRAALQQNARENQDAGPD